MSIALALETQGDFTRPGATTLPRFTPAGSGALERHLARVCKQIAAGVADIIPGRMLEGLALGGGYGRGEGGVLKTPQGDQPYNDLEFYIFVRRQPCLTGRRYARRLHALAKSHEPGAGVELEFKIISAAQLRRSPQSLFYHDLLTGHRWLLGDDRLFAGCEHHGGARSIPVSEATRLLMNRCSGLLFASEKLEHDQCSAEDADFVCRNIAKTELALGDAVLIAFGKYHWSCEERDQRLHNLGAADDLPWIEEVRLHHATGVQFKLEPRQTSLSRAMLWEQLCAVRSLALRVWLWLENRRLGCGFLSAADYISSNVNKWPDTSKWRNWLANLRVFGVRALLLPRNRRHPRERILNALVLMLWGAGRNPIGRTRGERSAQFNTQVRHELICAEPTAIMTAYRQRWGRAS